MLLILTIFVMCSVVEAGEKKCEAGEGDNKFTLYIGQVVMNLKGSICIFDTDTAEWQGKDMEGNSVYFSGTYIVRGGHHSDSKVVKSKPRNNDQTIGW